MSARTVLTCAMSIPGVVFVRRGVVVWTVSSVWRTPGAGSIGVGVR